MAESRYDCIVIGSGPGGYVAAIRAAQLDMKTAVVEKDKLGGRCLNYACIPAKAVLRAADVFSEVKDAGEFGIQLNGAEPTVDFEATSQHRDKVVQTLTGGVGSLMKSNKVDVIEGLGSVTGDGNVRVGGDEIEAGSVILATGSIAKPLLGLEFGERVLDTERAWALRELPKKMAVIGASASGSEIASAYGRLGTEVTLPRGPPPDPPYRGRGDRQGGRERDPQAERQDRDRGQRRVGRGERRRSRDHLRRRDRALRLPGDRRGPRAGRRGPRARRRRREDGG